MVKERVEPELVARLIWEYIPLIPDGFFVNRVWGVDEKLTDLISQICLYVNANVL